MLSAGPAPLHKAPGSPGAEQLPGGYLQPTSCLQTGISSRALTINPLPVSPPPLLQGAAGTLGHVPAGQTDAGGCQGSVSLLEINLGPGFLWYCSASFGAEAMPRGKAPGGTGTDPARRIQPGANGTMTPPAQHQPCLCGHLRGAQILDCKKMGANPPFSLNPNPFPQIQIHFPQIQLCFHPQWPRCSQCRSPHRPADVLFAHLNPPSALIAATLCKCN